MTATDVRSAGHEHDDELLLRLVAHHGIDLEAASRAVSDLLVALGQDPTSEVFAKTPRRVAALLAQELTPAPFTMTTFANDVEYDEMVIVRDISFHSLCTDHLLPVTGVAHIAYLPQQRVVGLSKLVRVVEHFSRRLQTQERLTTSIADALQTALAPRGVGVRIEATHLCLTLRGISASGTTTVTTALTGRLRDDAATRSEFAELTSRHS